MKQAHRFDGILPVKKRAFTVEVEASLYNRVKALKPKGVSIRQIVERGFQLYCEEFSNEETNLGKKKIPEDG